MKKTRIIIVGILAFVWIFSVFVVDVRSKDIDTPVLYVGGGGDGNYSSIQAAVNNASAGVTVFVYNGTYVERLNITKSLILTGEDNTNTVIDGGASGFVVILAADYVTLSNFTITGSEDVFPFAGIYVTSNYNTISNNILTDNFYGMQLGYATSHNLIINNSIYQNKRCGVYFNHSSDNTLVGNSVRNHPVNGFGLFEYSNNNIIVNNTFFRNGYSGVNIRESYDNAVIGNSFIQDQNGLHKPSPEYHTVAQDNIFTENIISLEEERDAIAFTVVVFDILVVLAYLVFRKLFA
jgi:nitrous oxidase accessory protein